MTYREQVIESFEDISFRSGVEIRDPQEASVEVPGLILVPRVGVLGDDPQILTFEKHDVALP